MQAPTTLIFSALVLGGLVVLVLGYRAADIHSRRKVRLIMAGCSLGMLNLVMLVSLETFGFSGSTAHGAVLSLIPLTVSLIPVSFAYAIVKHQVIPVGLIIRRSIRYLLVSRGSALLLIVIVAVTMFFVLNVFFDYVRPGSGRTVGIVSSIVAVIVWQTARTFHLRVVAPWVDKLFFRQAYDSRQIITELVESLRTATDRRKLLELTATKIQSALHATNVTILVRDETGDYLSAYSRQYSFHNRSAVERPCACRLSRDSIALIFPDLSGEPIDFHQYLSSQNGGAKRLPSEDLEALGRLEPALIMPIMGKEAPLAIISIGPHLGDLPFSNDDRKLLLSINGPISFALENARLLEQMVEDARRRQELEAENEQRARELEEARLLQLSMLPKKIPSLPHLEIAAYMKTATEVGGDYYDFRLSDAGVLTIAVGDATGHGLKAGTVVTATKGLFNYPAQNAALTERLRNWSSALKAMNLRSLFMALTLVEVEGYRLKISAAGMPPALIYRAERKAVEEAPISGVPLGSIVDYEYRQRDVRLSPGDVVLLITDGLIERFNHRGEMFELERVKDALVESAARSPQEIIDHLVAKGDEWADGKPQDDDATFVALKIK